METLLRRLTHVLMVATWLGAVALAAIWHLPAAAGLFAAGVLGIYFGRRLGFFRTSSRRDAERDAVNTEREAKYMVTQILRTLTRIQVAYLCQDFKSRAASRAWLKQALPRNLRQSLDELHSGLENARLGTPPPGLKLALRILELREPLLDMEKALDQAHREYPSHEVAHPVVFVVTEHLGATSDAEPEVVTLAGWDPSVPTLLPRVDAVTFLSPGDGGKQVRGQADFKNALEALSREVRPVDQVSSIYAAEPISDPAQHGVKLDKVPLGFVVGAAELI
jgi:hypothetical protein